MEKASAGPSTPETDEGSALVQQAPASHRFGSYTLQAAIAAVHAKAAGVALADWPRIVALFDHICLGLIEDGKWEVNSMRTNAGRDLTKVPVHLQGLLHHFFDLRDGTHGDGAVSRADKEALFFAAVAYLAPYARQALSEINEALLLADGTVAASGVTRSPAGDLSGVWTLNWPEQQQAGLPPISLEAIFGHSFHHPHLRGATVGVWPLNVFSDADGAAELPTLRAIAAAELHNLVFRGGFRIVPAISRG